MFGPHTVAELEPQDVVHRTLPEPVAVVAAVDEVTIKDHGGPALHEQDAHLIDTITRLSLAPHDLIVMKVHRAIPPTQMRALRDGLRAGAPHWDGALLTLREDQDLYRLEDAAARELYQYLRRRFEKA